MPENLFDEQVAARYDETSADMFDSAVLDPAVDLLAELAGGGRALELGIGTGRVAVPLRARGVPGHGIDISEPMLARLRSKPGAEDTAGDFATTQVDGSFRLVYLVFNTITNLLTQDEQVECFRNAAAHLEPGGSFVVEVSVPALQRLPPGDTLQVFDRSAEHVGIDEYDVVTQSLWSHHHQLVDGSWQAVSMPFRYVWPAELDLMARIAGLEPRDRWADWEQRLFTSESTSHVSVWTKPD